MRLVYIGSSSTSPEQVHMEEDDRELQLLPDMKHRSSSSSSSRHNKMTSGPSLELKLCSYGYECVERLKWEAAEQIRLAALEKAYAERLRELTRREMELAQSEFATARHVCERAREEVEMAQRLKDTATRRLDDPPTITCYSCRQKFRPT